MVYAGIDLHKNLAYVTVMDEDGKVLKRAKLRADLEKMARFFRPLRRTEVSVALEPVNGWQVLHGLLTGMGCVVHLAHPTAVRDHAAETKTDRNDATLLAHLLRTNFLTESYAPPQAVREMRELVRFRASLVRLRTQVKNRIRALLARVGTQTPRVSDLFGKKGRAFLRSLALPSPFQQSLGRYLELLGVLDAQVAAVDVEIEKRAMSHRPARLLTTIPGISYFLALVIASEIGDIWRFPTWKKLATYAGITPQIRDSDGHGKTHGTSRRSSRWLRWALKEAAQKHATMETASGRTYRRIAQRKKNGVARIAGARSPVRIIHAMLRRYEPYREAPVFRGTWWGPRLSLTKILRYGKRRFIPTFRLGGSTPLERL